MTKTWPGAPIASFAGLESWVRSWPSLAADPISMYRNVLLTICALSIAGLAGCASRPATRTLYYQCFGGQHIDVTYHPDGTAIVQIGARPIEMRRAESPIGQRYVGSDLQWLIQTRHDVPVGTLYTRGRNGGLGQIAEHCRLTGSDD